MKTMCVLFSAGVMSVWAQPVTFGVKGGVPLTDFVDAARSPNFGFNSTTQRYIVGPTVELRLPFGLGIEFDALYRRLHYDGSGTLAGAFTTSRTTGNAWEFPLLAKYRFPSKVVRPFVDAGVAWDRLSGVEQSLTSTVNLVAKTSIGLPAELRDKTTVGAVVGAGLDIHALFLHISPEVRYTHWGARHFSDAAGLLRSNQNQAEFLLGITF